MLNFSYFLNFYQNLTHYAKLKTFFVYENLFNCRKMSCEILMRYYPYTKTYIMTYGNTQTKYIELNIINGTSN